MFSFCYFSTLFLFVCVFLSFFALYYFCLLFVCLFLIISLPLYRRKNPASERVFSQTSQMVIEAALKAPENFTQCRTKGRWLLAARHHKNSRWIGSIKNAKNVQFNREKFNSIQCNPIQFNVQLHLETDPKISPAGLRRTSKIDLQCLTEPKHSPVELM